MVGEFVKMKTCASVRGPTMELTVNLVICFLFISFGWKGNNTTGYKESDIFECLFIISVPKRYNNWLKSKNQS